MDLRQFLKQFTVLMAISFSLINLVACKKVSVDLKSISALNGFSVDQSSVSAKAVTNPNFSVSGKCSKDLNSIEVSFDKGFSWLNLNSVSTANVQCEQSGTFSATFNKDLSAYLNMDVLRRAGGILLRASGDLGISDSKLVVVLEKIGGLRPNLVSSAKFQKTQDNYKVYAGLFSGETNSFQNMPAGATGYKVKNLRLEAVK